MVLLPTLYSTTPLNKGVVARSVGPNRMAAKILDWDATTGSRCRLHTQSLVDSFEGRDQWLASGMETGVDEGYAKLDALLAELR